MPGAPLDAIVPDWPEAPARIGALVTTRRGGVSRAPYGIDGGDGGLNLGSHVGDRPGDVQANRTRLQALLPSAPKWLNQVHGCVVADAEAVTAPPDADAVVAAAPGQVCAILTADCLPVLFCDQAAQVVAAAHGGWRGLAAGVLENTVARMRQRGAGEISAWLGPAIGPQRFEVGPEVRAAFLARSPENQTAFAAQDNGKYLADIYRLARIALAGAGVERVGGGGFCTVTDARRFYSYRRDGVTGRMAALVWIKPED